MSCFYDELDSVESYSLEFHFWLSHFVLAEVNESRKPGVEEGWEGGADGDDIIKL